MRGQRRSSLALSLWGGRLSSADKDLVVDHGAISSRKLPTRSQGHAQKALHHFADATISTRALAELGNRSRGPHAIPESWLPARLGSLRFR
jgi:hypothetical protein